MRIYAAIREVGPITENVLTGFWRDLADLRQTGFLNDDSTVWLNPSYPTLGMWVLNDKSTHVQIRRTAEPGWAVLMRDSVRFGPTVRAALAAKDSSIYTLDDVPSFTNPTRSTILVMHNAPGKTLGFRKNSAIQRPYDGQCSNQNFTVIDMALWQRRGFTTGTPSELAKAHAMVSGVELLTHGMTEEGREFVHNNLELFSAPFTDPGFDRIQTASRYLEQVGQTTARLLAANVARNIYNDDGDILPGARESGAVAMVNAYTT